MEIWFPYGPTEVALRIPEESYQGSLLPKASSQPIALDESIGELIYDKLGEGLSSKRILVIIEHTSNVSVCKALASYLIKSFLRKDIKRDSVRFLISRGWDPYAAGISPEDLMPEDALRYYTYHTHDLYLSKVHPLDFSINGSKVRLNNLLTDSDIKIVLSQIRPSFAGVVGGPTALLPGLADLETTRRLFSKALESGQRDTGYLELSSVYPEMLEAVHEVGVDLAIGYVSDYKGDLAALCAGDITGVLQLREIVKDLYAHYVANRPSTWAIGCGGASYDQTLYDASEALLNVGKMPIDGASVIWVAECAKGVGSDELDKLIRTKTDLGNLMAELDKGFSMERYKAYAIGKLRERIRVYAVTTLPDYIVRKVFGAKAFRTCNAAITAALKAAGRGAKVLAIPYGNLTMLT